MFTTQKSLYRGKLLHQKETFNELISICSFVDNFIGIHVRPDSAVYDIRINVEKGEDGPINKRDLIVRSGIIYLKGGITVFTDFFIYF